MKKFLAVLLLIAALILVLLAGSTAINLVFISMRPETISVLNVIIGQGVLIILLLALAKFCSNKGFRSLGSRSSTGASEE